MQNDKNKSGHEDLIARLKTPGWNLTAGGKASPAKGNTLEDIVRTAHERHKRGEEPGLISQAETEFELDMIQLQKLWEYLGLPM
jgi:hypothetical protein